MIRHGRAGQRDYFRRAARDDDAAGVPGVQLDARGLRGGDGGIGDDGGGGGQVGVVRRDPMAMLPFIGYNIRDYLVHWFRMRRKMSDCPRIFHVNWFRKDAQGKFLWPGFGENMRVLKWIIDRAHGRAYARETVLGWMPRVQDFDLEGLDISRSRFERCSRLI
jgi:phosphoenolpyruvate carboxykinase (GTP)